MLFFKNSIINKGHGNILPKRCFCGLRIKINGNNNIIEIDDNAIFLKARIIINGDNNYIKINRVSYLRYFDLNIYNGNKQSFFIGDCSTCEGARIFMCNNNSKLTIGKDCMLSSEIEIWTADGHPICDLSSGEILNDKPAELVIGDHTWVCRGCKLLKNTYLPQGTVVGSYSVLSKKFQEKNTIIAGTPPRIIRKNIIWQR